MGEYARAYTLEHFGVDIGGDEDDEAYFKREEARRRWKCKLCGRKLLSEGANANHMKDKHGIEAAKPIPSQEVQP